MGASFLISSFEKCDAATVFCFVWFCLGLFTVMFLPSCSTYGLKWIPDTQAMYWGYSYKAMINEDLIVSHGCVETCIGILRRPFGKGESETVSQGPQDVTFLHHHSLKNRSSSLAWQGLVIRVSLISGSLCFLLSLCFCLSSFRRLFFSSLPANVLVPVVSASPCDFHTLPLPFVSQEVCTGRDTVERTVGIVAQVKPNSFRICDLAMKCTVYCRCCRLTW